MHSKQQPTAGNYDSRTADKFVVRFPDGMRSRIEDLAKSQHRSMNSEIIARLERSIMDSELVERQTLLIQQLSTRIKELEQHQSERVSVSPWQWTDAQVVQFLGLAMRNVDIVGELHLDEIRQAFALVDHRHSPKQQASVAVAQQAES